MRGASKGVLEGRRNGEGEGEGADFALDPSLAAALRTAGDRKTDLAAAIAIFVVDEMRKLGFIGLSFRPN